MTILATTLIAALGLASVGLGLYCIARDLADLRDDLRIRGARTYPRAWLADD